jgi:hypothetical protein
MGLSMPSRKRRIRVSIDGLGFIYQQKSIEAGKEQEAEPNNGLKKEAEANGDMLCT